MSKRSSYPPDFVKKYFVKGLLQNPRDIRFVIQQFRRHFQKCDPRKDYPIDQISIRVNEACNLRCHSCGQWGENGHLLKKFNEGQKLDSISFETCKKIIDETKKDNPVYYIWGGEPSLWKPLVPFFEELGRNKLIGSMVTNCQNILPHLEPLLLSGGLRMLFISLDAWDSEFHNKMRPAANGQESNNFEKTMEVINKVDELKKKHNLLFPFVVPITVISNTNYQNLDKIRELVEHKTQLHQIFYGWFITEERACEHEKVFEQNFGHKPQYHRGYLKSCFNDVDPVEIASSIAGIREQAKGKNSVPQIIPEIYSQEELTRYYNDHSWSCGYEECTSIYHVAEISPDGRVTPCRDYQDFFCGNVNEQSFYEIWNGPQYKEFRSKLKKGLMPVCSRCCGLQGF